MKETYMVRKFSKNGTIHSFDSWEWHKGRMEEIFLWILLSRQNVREEKNSPTPHFQNPMQKELGKYYTCHPFVFL